MSTDSLWRLTYGEGGDHTPVRSLARRLLTHESEDVQDLARAFLAEIGQPEAAPPGWQWDGDNDFWFFRDGPYLCLVSAWGNVGWGFQIYDNVAAGEWPDIGHIPRDAQTACEDSALVALWRATLEIAEYTRVD